jgi:predicted enzyme related to lactoylglutathione lyase
MVKSTRVIVFLIVSLGVSGSGILAGENSSQALVHTIASPQYFALYVQDVDSSVGWYRTAFGLRDLGGSQAEDDSWRIENLGNDRLMIEVIRDDRAQPAGRALGFRKVGFYVPDVEEVAERVERMTGERPNIVEYGKLNQRILQLRDPDGNVIQLMSTIEK